MKKLSLILLFIVSISYAQKDNAFGVVGGLNYNSNGDFESLSTVQESSKQIGFHIGLFGKLDLGPIYVRPEFLYTRTKSEYNIDDLFIDKLDAPILVGLDVLGPLSVFAGPSFQYILNNEFEDITLTDAENRFTIGAQLGVGLNFDKFGIDVRYERGLSENEASITGTPDFRVDTRPEQIILSLSVKL